MNRVKELSDRKGILQKQLAISIGVSRPTVSDWWNQKKDPRGERLTKLSDYFGVTNGVILGYEPVPASYDNPDAQSQQEHEGVPALVTEESPLTRESLEFAVHKKTKDFSRDELVDLNAMADIIIARRNRQ